MQKSLIGALVLSLGSLVSLPVHSDTMTWTVQSTYPFKVQLEFYSRQRDAAWPGNGRAYDLNDSEEHTFTLRCQTGEKICYGAWPTGGDKNGKYREWWGVGANDKFCQHCCYICGESDPGINLTDNDDDDQ